MNQEKKIVLNHRKSRPERNGFFNDIRLRRLNLLRSDIRLPPREIVLRTACKESFSWNDPADSKPCSVR